jgi:hypothetical protein
MFLVFAFDSLVEQHDVIIEQPHERIAAQDSRFVSPGHFPACNLLFREGNQSGDVPKNAFQNALRMASLPFVRQLAARGISELFEAANGSAQEFFVFIRLPNRFVVGPPVNGGPFAERFFPHFDRRGPELVVGQTAKNCQELGGSADRCSLLIGRDSFPAWPSPMVRHTGAGLRVA